MPRRKNGKQAWMGGFEASKMLLTNFTFNLHFFCSEVSHSGITSSECSLLLFREAYWGRACQLSASFAFCCHYPKAPPHLLALQLVGGEEEEEGDLLTLAHTSHSREESWDFIIWLLDRFVLFIFSSFLTHFSFFFLSSYIFLFPFNTQTGSQGCWTSRKSMDY